MVSSPVPHPVAMTDHHMVPVLNDGRVSASRRMILSQGLSVPHAHSLTWLHGERSPSAGELMGWDGHV